MSKGHIVFVTTGDIENIATSKRAFGMTEPLVALGYDISIILQNTPSNRDRLAMEAPSARAIWFEAGSALSEMRMKRRKLAELAADIVYVGSYGIRNLVAPFRPSRSLYIVEHSELPSAIQNRSMSRRAADFVLERLSVRAFDGQVCASRYLEEFICSKLPLNKTGRVHYSPYAFTRSILAPDGQRQTNMGSGKKHILYMGTLARNYGIFQIMDAIAELRLENTNFIFVVLGKGRHFNEAVDYAKKLNLDDFIDFQGYVSESDLGGYLQRADVFVAPIFNTVQDIARCPSKMFMYVLFDRPVVTSCIGEARELFGDDYDFYFSPGNVEQLANRLQTALDTPTSWTPPWNAADHEWTKRVQALDVWLDQLRNGN